MEPLLVAGRATTNQPSIVTACVQLNLSFHGDNPLSIVLPWQPAINRLS